VALGRQTHTLYLHPKPTLCRPADTAERLDMSRKGYSTCFWNRTPCLQISYRGLSLKSCSNSHPWQKFIKCLSAVQIVPKSGVVYWDSHNTLRYIKNVFFWDVMPCGSFGGTSPPSSVWKNQRARNNVSSN
jgi:hypothetical protein